MKKHSGFTLIELVIFIVITSILASAIMLSFITTMNKAPALLQNMIASQTAQQCAEWFIGQRRVNGYDSITCDSTVPTFCTAPTGFAIAVSCTPTTINSDTNYETITITVSGAGDASTNLLLANY